MASPVLTLTPIRSGNLTAQFTCATPLTPPAWLPSPQLSVWFQDYPYAGAHVVLPATEDVPAESGDSVYIATLNLAGDELDSLPTYRLGWVSGGVFVEIV